MSRLCILACLLAFGACAPAAEAPPSVSAEDSEQQLRPAYKLVGKYRIAGINGKAVDAPIGLTLSITPKLILFDAPCNGFSWAYRYSGTRISLGQRVRPDPACIAAARIHHLVFDAAGAIDAASQAGKDPSNALVLSGGGKSVTLYSQ